MNVSTGRRLAHALVAAGALCAIGAAALAEADGPDFWRVAGVAATDQLNIRATPSPRAKSLGGIPHDGDSVENLGCRGELTFAQWEKASPAQRERARRARWCKVRWRGVTGWVAGRYLVEASAPR